jgi:hypothetical protein
MFPRVLHFFYGNLFRPGKRPAGDLRIVVYLLLTHSILYSVAYIYVSSSACQCVARYIVQVSKVHSLKAVYDNDGCNGGMNR